MTVVVPGARPNSFDIQTAIILNSTFRAWTSTNVQMDPDVHPCRQSTGREAHAYTDQALRLEAGKGRRVMDRCCQVVLCDWQD